MCARISARMRTAILAVSVIPILLGICGGIRSIMLEQARVYGTTPLSFRSIVISIGSQEHILDDSEALECIGQAFQTKAHSQFVPGCKYPIRFNLSDGTWFSAILIVSNNQREIGISYLVGAIFEPEEFRLTIPEPAPRTVTELLKSLAPDPH